MKKDSENVQERVVVYVGTIGEKIVVEKIRTSRRAKKRLWKDRAHLREGGSMFKSTIFVREMWIQVLQTSVLEKEIKKWEAKAFAACTYVRGYLTQD